MKAISKKRMLRARTLVDRAKILADYNHNPPSRERFMQAWQLRRDIMERLADTLGKRLYEQYRAVRIGVCLGLSMQSDRQWAEEVFAAALGARLAWTNDGCIIRY